MKTLLLPRYNNFGYKISTFIKVQGNHCSSVLDDETFIVMDDEQIDDIPTLNCNCGKLTMVGDPVTWKKSGRMFGFWGKFHILRKKLD